MTEIVEGFDVEKFINEAFRIKVNFKGKKRRKLKCARGMKVNAAGTACVPITAQEKKTNRLAKRKMVRTKRMKGASAKRRQMVKTKRAMRFRKNMGL